MANFFVVISADGFQDDADRLFRSGLEVARELALPAPSTFPDATWASAAFFPRMNGSGTPIVSDPATGSWLLAIGTWFHSDDYGVGSESRLLSRYLETGPGQLGKELEGFFAVVVGDSRSRAVTVLTDIVGSCHCFLRQYDHVVALSGSSLLLAALGDCSLDPIGGQEFVRTGILYEDRTLFREVRKLGPASVYRFADGAQQPWHRYWRIADIVPDSLDGPHAVEALWDSLTRSARRIGRTFTRPVCDLTGGYDSRVIVAAFLDAGVRFSTTVSGPETSADVAVSGGLARMIGLPHLHVAATPPASFAQVKAALPFTDGEYDLVEYARILEIHRRLSNGSDLSVNGSFGEVARGYWWELLFPRAGARESLDASKVARLRYAAHAEHPPLFAPEIELRLVPHFAGIIERTNAGLSALPNTAQMDHSYLMMRMQCWQGRIASSTNRLWPCLSPFLFRSVLETMLRATARIRKRSLLVRRMLARFQPRVAEFPLEHGHPAAPLTWANCYKFWPLVLHYEKKCFARAMRFCPGSWVREATRTDTPPVRLHLLQDPEVKDLLRPAEMRLRCLMDEKKLEAFLGKAEQQVFPFDSQWSRVLTLEYTLRTLTSIRR